MSRLFVHGTGAVSPAGWDVMSLAQTVKKSEPLPHEILVRPGWDRPLRIRPVPAPAKRPPFLNHPRLRRAGALTHHAVSASLEAIGCDAERIKAKQQKLGIIVCTLAGNVNYSRRFYQEVLTSPSLASPILFPETVFNAPASHLAALLSAETINYTLVGDNATFLQGLAMAAAWIIEEKVDSCLVVGAEEMDWAVVDALNLFHPNTIYAAGAGAIYLKSSHSPVELELITDAFSYTQSQPKNLAARQMQLQLPVGHGTEMLCDNDTRILDWSQWSGGRVTPHLVLGEAFVASAAWQCVYGCETLFRRQYSASNISMVGLNQQAIGARFVSHVL